MLDVTAISMPVSHRVELFVPFECHTLTSHRAHLSHSSRGEARSDESIKQTASRFRRLCLSNAWDYFFTITFDGSMYDRNSWNTISAVQTYFHWLVKKDSGFRYIFVVEMHQDGAFHVHGLFSKSSSIKLRYGRQIHAYYSPKLRAKFGSNRIHKLTARSASRAVAYCSKYMQKTLAAVPAPSAYYRSRNLSLPEKLAVPSFYASFLRRYLEYNHGSPKGLPFRFSYVSCDFGLLFFFSSDAFDTYLSIPISALLDYFRCSA